MNPLRLPARLLSVLFICLTVSLLLACGGGSNSADSGTVASIKVTTSAVLLTQAGQTATLAARVLDANGNVLNTPVTWESSQPGGMPVSADGVVTAQGTGGSAQFFARVGNVKSAPVLLAYTEVAAGAKVVNDAQILGDPVETTPDAPFSVDNTFSVRLSGTAAPSVGQIVVNTGNKPVVGRVKAVSTDSTGVHTVTLGMVQIFEALPQLRIHETIDLSNLPVQIPTDVLADYDVVRQGSRFTYTPKPARATATLAQSVRAMTFGRSIAAGSEPFVLTDTTVGGKSFKCTFTTEGAAGAGSPPFKLSKLPTFDVEFNPQMFIDYVPEERVIKELVLQAQPNVTATASFEMELDVSVDPKVTCVLELQTIPAPTTGIFAVLLSPTVTLSGGVELSAKTSLAGVKIGATSQISNTVEVGFRQCDIHNCVTVANLSAPTVNVKPTISDLGDNVRFEPSVFGYGMVQVGLGSSVFKSLHAEALYLKLGPALKASLQTVNGQIDDTAPDTGVSKYSIDAQLKAGLETKFLQAAAWFGLNGLAENLIDKSWPITQSPTGKAKASVGSFKAGDRVDVEVKLDQENTTFLGFYNVDRVIIYRRTGSAPAREVAGLTAPFDGVTTFQTGFIADADGQTSELYAFVRTRSAVMGPYFHDHPLELGPVTAPAEQSGERLGAGASHTCALTGGGGVKCWGSNADGQLGGGTVGEITTPLSVSGLGSGVTSIGSSRSNFGSHNCALTSAGGVKCWGYNYYGQLGNASTTSRMTPVDVMGLNSGVKAIGVGNHHTCALTTAERVKCWGSNFYGELGNGTTTVYDNTTTMNSTPVDVTGLGSEVIAISAGGSHTCAITRSGGVKCWGYNHSGELGNGNNTNSSTPVDVVNLGSGVVAVSAGLEHTCAITSAGGVKCWGYNLSGQLGNGFSGYGADTNTPVDVVDLTSGVVAISAGAYHTCAITSAGRVKCWGDNARGQLGNGATATSSTPVSVQNMSAAKAVSAGNLHSCAMTDTGTVKCWGSDYTGQLGDGNIGDEFSRTVPVSVINFP